MFSVPWKTWEMTFLNHKNTNLFGDFLSPNSLATLATSGCLKFSSGHFCVYSLKNACHAPALQLTHPYPICLSVFLIVRQKHEQATNQLTNWFSMVTNKYNCSDKCLGWVLSLLNIYSGRS